jgi:hypothetical protein
MAWQASRSVYIQHVIAPQGRARRRLLAVAVEPGGAWKQARKAAGSPIVVSTIDIFLPPILSASLAMWHSLCLRILR